MQDDELKITWKRWLPGDPEMEAALRLVDAMEFQADPLDTGTPIPPHVRREQCDCDPTMVSHLLRCPASPIFLGLVTEAGLQAIVPPTDPALMDVMWPWRWVCFNAGEPHYGGMVNGPEHWCIKARKMITY